MIIMETLNETPFGEMDTILEVKKGTLILLHGRIPHNSCENKSNKSRHASDGKLKFLVTNFFKIDYFVIFKLLRF